MTRTAIIALLFAGTHGAEDIMVPRPGFSSGMTGWSGTGWPQSPRVVPFEMRSGTVSDSPQGKVAEFVLGKWLDRVGG